MRELKIEAHEAGQRLDKYLQKYMAQAPKSFLYKMLPKKNITCNQKKCDGSEHLMEGDIIRLFLSEETIEGFRKPKEAVTLYSENPLSVIYEDTHVLLLNKPAGILSQKAGKEDISMVEYLISYLLEKGDVTEESLRSFRPSVCNRLDRNTSGLITAGKTLQGSKELSALIRERSVKKYYLCLVDGIVKENARIHGWLLKDEASNQVKVFQDKREGASEIYTAYEPLSHGKDLTLLKTELITGRSHQIRAHLASIGHPVIGDGKYGIPSVNRKFRNAYHLEYQLLHAYCMEFPRLSGVLSGLSRKQIFAPLPEIFEKILKDEKIARKGIM